MEVDPSLASLASDSARWKRLGPVGTLNFVQGVLESLMTTGAITRDEVLAMKRSRGRAYSSLLREVRLRGSVRAAVRPRTSPH